ncbi:lamin tail domain-containing protein [Halorubellus sp. PRR65]|uniref:lamin tail domain-containing protein n=1 Tax=Halorubellus sp. PRR65 TaxID=3098148 RepID=UPI002B25938A|nr:lamin tail domain-containing protein [Halorubellus sp. PRR65]
MSVVERLPRLEPGLTLRNVLLVVFYLWAILVLVGLLIYTLPFVVAVVLGLNVRGSADRLSAIPGISTDGGLSTAVVAGGYMLCLYGVILALAWATSAPAATQTTPPATTMPTASGSDATVAATTQTTPTTTTVASTVSTGSTTTTASSSISTQASTTDATATPTVATTAPPTTTTTATVARTTTAASTTGSERRTEWQVDVVRVVDGDTLEVAFPDGRVARVRLLGVDTPEVHTGTNPSEFEEIPESDAGRAWLRDWGHKASDFARTQLQSETVTIRTDSDADRRGAYGRLLVYVRHDGESFNEQLLAQGYARVYESSFSNREHYLALEATARSNDVGLWNYDPPTEITTTMTTTTSVATTGTGELVVVDVHADAAGNDHENENDEYTVFKNAGDRELSLAGWRVEDEADHVYYFPDITVAPGATVTLYTGSGTDSDTAVYWGSDAAIWNNGGDTIYVYDDSGNLEVEYTYGAQADQSPIPLVGLLLTVGVVLRRL